jgi:energy-converting hydrogenase Eha subunit G
MIEETSGLSLAVSFTKYTLELLIMTDLMNLAFVVLAFGLGAGFIWACEKLK